MTLAQQIILKLRASPCFRHLRGRYFETAGRYAPPGVCEAEAVAAIRFVYGYYCRVCDRWIDEDAQSWQYSDDNLYASWDNPFRALAYGFTPYQPLCGDCSHDLANFTRKWPGRRHAGKRQAGLLWLADLVSRRPPWLRTGIHSPSPYPAPEDPLSPTARVALERHRKRVEERRERWNDAALSRANRVLAAKSYKNPYYASKNPYSIIMEKIIEEHPAEVSLADIKQHMDNLNNYSLRVGRKPIPATTLTKALVHCDLLAERRLQLSDWHFRVHRPPPIPLVPQTMPLYFLRDGVAPPRDTDKTWKGQIVRRLATLDKRHPYGGLSLEELAEVLRHEYDETTIKHAQRHLKELIANGILYRKRIADWLPRHTVHYVLGPVFDGVTPSRKKPPKPITARRIKVRA